ncbi:MAG: hypothetical protein J6V07_05650, partial [Clostridia bacterium]|nr:hypothetical protein [Clostridia bacterium]
MNRITVDKISVLGNRIEYEYSVSGEWQEAFRLEERFFVEYSRDVSTVPSSIAVIPLLANLLPMSWAYDAEIVVPECDRDFYESIPEFKRGYEEMYPMLSLGGRLLAKEIVDAEPRGGERAAVFFSGGVDAFNTLVCHMDENPCLITVWGADIKLSDEVGWERVLQHLGQVREEFSVDCYTVRSSFRLFLSEGILSRRVAASGDGWWHGFQHGVGMYAMSAPLAYLLGLRRVYFASTYTIADKGIVPCASDPTIDNYVRFCGAAVCHDGNELTRQEKIGNITAFATERDKRIPLRVCWVSSGGSNCCRCEKCWRTILGILAEGKDPHEYGFDYTDAHGISFYKALRNPGSLHTRATYAAIQDRMRVNIPKEQLPRSVRWFYGFDVEKVGVPPLYRKLYRKTRALVARA